MNNPLEILQVFDRHLEHRTEVTLFGRSALALAFPPAPSEYAATRDVDVILPLQQLELLRTEQSFWSAQEATNLELQPRGLYMTHLFSEVDVILQPDWFSRRISVPVQLQKIAAFRPATVDLVLTKMARADSEDLADIEFLLRKEAIETADLQIAFTRARVPDVSEIRELFGQAKPKVLAIAKRLEEEG